MATPLDYYTDYSKGTGYDQGNWTGDQYYKGGLGYSPHNMLTGGEQYDIYGKGIRHPALLTAGEQYQELSSKGQTMKSPYMHPQGFTGVDKPQYMGGMDKPQYTGGMDKSQYTGGMDKPQYIGGMDKPQFSGGPSQHGYGVSPFYGHPGYMGHGHPGYMGYGHPSSYGQYPYGSFPHPGYQPHYGSEGTNIPLSKGYSSDWTPMTHREYDWYNFPRGERSGREMDEKYKRGGMGGMGHQEKDWEGIGSTWKNYGTRGTDLTYFEGWWKPRADIFEFDNQVRVEFELPGVTKEHVALKAHGDSLILTSTKPISGKHEKAFYYQNERHFGNFYRRLTLPVGVDSTKVQAVLENGILKVTLPKTMGFTGMTGGSVINIDQTKTTQ